MLEAPSLPQGRGKGPMREHGKGEGPRRRLQQRP